jgi:hypothetical protein
MKLVQLETHFLGRLFAQEISCNLQTAASFPPSQKPVTGIYSEPHKPIPYPRPLYL